MSVNRRQALTGGLLGLGGCSGVKVPGMSGLPGLRNLAPSPPATFAQGVASGDPARDSVVIWTRAFADGTARGTATVAEDEDFETVVWSAPFEAGLATDHTVKLVADGLKPGRRYFYKFEAGGETSPVGRTRTLPDDAAEARFAVMSCSNYVFGHFHAYDHAARQEFDAVIHLGDYIYEYGPDGYGGSVGAAIGRPHAPAREILTLADYRARHRQYKADPGSRAMHAAHALIAVWDDHETANNSWEGGAENHQPDEGDWRYRKRAALQAYYEYMPVRDPRPGEGREAFWRSFTWGGLLTLCAIETRLSARSRQFEYADVVPQLTSPEAIEAWRKDVLGDPARSMMGAEQSAYVQSALAGSAARGEPWRLIANQVIMAEVKAPDLASALTEADIAKIEDVWPPIRDFVAFTRLGLPLNVDAWDGYPAARERLYAEAKAANAKDMIVLTGDTHEAWANVLVADDGTKMGVELGATGVTSPGPSAYLGEQAADYSDLLVRTNPQVMWHDTRHHGYIDLTLDRNGGRADFVAVSDVTKPDYDARLAKTVVLRKGKVGVELEI